MSLAAVEISLWLRPRCRRDLRFETSAGKALAPYRLGFGEWGAGFGISGLGVGCERVSGVECRVTGVGFRHLN